MFLTIDPYKQKEQQNKSGMLDVQGLYFYVFNFGFVHIMSYTAKMYTL